MRRVPRARALTYAVFACLLGGVAWAVGVGSVFGQRAEAFVLEAAELNYTPPAPLGLVNTPVAVFTLLVLALLAWWVHGLRRSITVFAAVAIAVVASQLLKQDVLVRPELFEFNAVNTFPSGHMTVFAALSGALVWAVPKPAQTLATVLTAGLCATVAWQLLEHSWHRPSDVIGALALTLFVFAMSALIDPLSSRRSLRPGRGRGTAVRAVLNIGLLWVAVLLLVGGLALGLGAAATGSAALMLLAAQFALIGLSVLTIRALQALSP